MQPEIILKTILENKVVAIVRGFSLEEVLNLARAYYEGGIRCMEVTYDQSRGNADYEVLQKISAIKETMGDSFLVGAGTIMTPEQVKQVVEAGAEYIISPNVDFSVIEETKKLGRISIPGAFTPTEIASAYNHGADIVKLFPANMLGVPYVKSIKAPLKHIPLLITGGVTPDNIRDYMAAGGSAAGVGGKLVNKEWIAAGDYKSISAAAAAYMAALGG